MSLAATAFAGMSAAMDIKVTTREGKVYDLGCLKEGDKASERDQDKRIKAYIKERRAGLLADPVALAEFDEQIRNLRSNITAVRGTTGKGRA